MHLDNLFDGVKSLGELVTSNVIPGIFFIKFSLILGDSTNAFLNENWRAVSEAFKPIIKKTIENILIEMMNKIFNYIPLEYVVSGMPPVRIE